jgi:hypothetical protein
MYLSGHFKSNYLCFDAVVINLGEQFCFCLVGFVLEVAEIIEFVRAFATHDLGQLIFFGNLKRTIKLLGRLI